MLPTKGFVTVGAIAIVSFLPLLAFGVSLYVRVRRRLALEKDDLFIFIALVILIGVLTESLAC